MPFLGEDLTPILLIPRSLRRDVVFSVGLELNPIASVASVICGFVAVGFEALSSGEEILYTLLFCLPVVGTSTPFCFLGLLRSYRRMANPLTMLTRPAAPPPCPLLQDLGRWHCVRPTLSSVLPFSSFNDSNSNGLWQQITCQTRRTNGNTMKPFDLFKIFQIFLTWDKRLPSMKSVYKNRCLYDFSYTFSKESRPGGPGLEFTPEGCRHPFGAIRLRCSFRLSSIGCVVFGRYASHESRFPPKADATAIPITSGKPKKTQKKLADAFGSGDADRTSVTDTQEGNISGDDRNFLYFGYLPSGYAFSPRLSNIHFIKAGVLLKPLEKSHLFENFILGIDYHRYYKDKEAGGVSDADAIVSDDDLGSEIDLNIFWQILSDLSCTLEYGHFEPGNAYPDSANDSEVYFSIGVTITF